MFYLAPKAQSYNVSGQILLTNKLFFDIVIRLLQVNAPPDPVALALRKAFMVVTGMPARTAKEFVIQLTSSRTACVKDGCTGQSSYYVRDDRGQTIGKGASARKAWSDAAAFLRGLPPPTEFAASQANHRSPFGPGA